MDPTVNRRDLLAGWGTLALASMAGCVGDDDGDVTDDTEDTDDEQSDDPRDYEATDGSQDGEADGEESEDQKDDAEEDGTEENEEEDDAEGESGKVTLLTATGQGGFIGFDETSESMARQEGLQFPGADQNESWISFVAEVDEEAGTWSSTDSSFPILEVPDTLAASVEAPDGLSGDIDTDADHMTLTGELEITILDRTQDYEPLQNTDPFAFEIDMAVDESGELQGSASFDGKTGTVTLVENQFVIPATTDNPLVDGNVGLPSTDSGSNFLELTFDLELDELADPGDAVDEEDEEDDDGESDEGMAMLATGQGGLFAIDEESESIAREQGLQFPAGAEDQSRVTFLAEVDEAAGTWSSIETSFPILTVDDNLAVAIEAVNGVSGAIDTAGDLMTLDGELKLSPLDRNQNLELLEGAQPITFDIEMVVGQSGELQGSASFAETAGTVTLVDNQYTIDEETGNSLFDEAVGLPSADGGSNFLELQFDVEFEPVDPADTSD